MNLDLRNAAQQTILTDTSNNIITQSDKFKHIQFLSQAGVSFMLGWYVTGFFLPCATEKMISQPINHYRSPPRRLDMILILILYILLIREPPATLRLDQKL